MKDLKDNYFEDAILYKIELLNDWVDPHYGDEHLDYVIEYMIANNVREIKQTIKRWNESGQLGGKFSFISAEVLTDLIYDARHTE